MKTPRRLFVALCVLALTGAPLTAGPIETRGMPSRAPEMSPAMSAALASPVWNSLATAGSALKMGDVLKTTLMAPEVKQADIDAVAMVVRAAQDPVTAAAIHGPLEQVGFATQASVIRSLSESVTQDKQTQEAFTRTVAPIQSTLAQAGPGSSLDDLKISLDKLFTNAGGNGVIGDPSGAAVVAQGLGTPKVQMGLAHPTAHDKPVKPEVPSPVVGTQTQADIKGHVDSRQPKSYQFVKDAPILGYRINGDRFENLPAVIRDHIGATDQTKYTPEYLRQNIGSIIALQMNGDKPDFYVIGKDTFDSKYKTVAAAEVGAKNAKLMKGLLGVNGVDGLVKSDPNVAGALKTVPVDMLRMSDLGYAVDHAVTIQSPWGEQTKPAGKDAFLVWDAGKSQYYMVNTDDAGLPISYIAAKMPIQSKQGLIDRVEAAKPQRHSFIKDAPILGYRITSDKFEDLPEAIRKNLGTVDQTKYTPEYLRDKIGSIIALQMNGTTPDFYPIGMDAYGKYKAVPAADVGTKNAKLMKGVLGVAGMENLVKSDPNVVGALKTVPVEMVRMSEIGYPIGQEITIESPWGEQTKPVGKDAYLVWDASKNQYYMVNTDDKGLPISYVAK